MLKRGKMLSLLVMFALLITLFPSGNAHAATNWNLAWSDEFDGTSLNTSNWTAEIGTGNSGWGNNELQYYTNRPQNLQVTGGNLVITALKESYNGSSYTSARIKTQGKKSFTYGKIEARIKLPSGQGLWPAFWMLGTNIDVPGVGWPKCGETDIMERVNNNAFVNGTVHWDANGQADYGQISGTLDFSQYHVYSIEWDAKYIRWFVDGNQFNEFYIENGTGNTEEFQKPSFLLLNLAVGGNWPGSPNAATPFPAQMLVDYVRVYQASNAPNIVSGGASQMQAGATTS
ncbi:glycoside hydrolase family 16 protein [Paenibacillus sonchi]|uniref:glycoside hydrolase family 16 protein n=1 Tax=Paenibacillus sonchi TaxID=373687 RepID=UPI00030CDABF|nr:glycoside hydrolase family 16 protein [Paenibacillus sonchi]